MKSGKKIFFITFLVLGFLAAGSLYKHFNQSATAASKPVSQISVDLQKVKGAENAPIKIIEYSDFQCPSCKKAAPVIDHLRVAYPDKIQVIYRHFPLQSHQWSKPAHQSAECAARQGKFWQYHDALFQHQELWSVSLNPIAVFVEYAKESGLDLDAFAACLVDPQVEASIMSERKEGDDLQVRSTPTFFINEKRFVGSVELAQAGENHIRSILGLPELEQKNIPSATIDQTHAGHTH